MKTLRPASIALLFLFVASPWFVQAISQERAAAPVARVDKGGQERATSRPPAGFPEMPQKYASGESHFLLGGAKLINLAVTTDQPITICCSKYVIRRIVVTDATATPILAAGGLYDAASKGGNALVGTGQAYTTLTGSTKFLDLTLTAFVGTDVVTATTIYFALTMANAGACTVTVMVYGDSIP